MPDKQKGWIGIDLDGTIAKYEGFNGETVIGEPIPAMVQKVKLLLAMGYTVKIFTARVCKKSPDPNRDVEAIRHAIQAWTKKVLGEALEVTNEKDYEMIQLWDDRCKEVVPNTGEFISQIK